MSTTAPPVPATVDELLDPAWLTAALGLRFPGVEVTSATLGPVTQRVSTNVRFRIETSGELPSGLPPTLCGKGYFSEQGRAVPAVGAIEAQFYRELAPASGLHAQHGAGRHDRCRDQEACGHHSGKKDHLNAHQSASQMKP